MKTEKNKLIDLAIKSLEKAGLVALANEVKEEKERLEACDKWGFYVQKMHGEYHSLSYHLSLVKLDAKERKITNLTSGGRQPKGWFLLVQFPCGVYSFKHGMKIGEYRACQPAFLAGMDRFKEQADHYDIPNNCFYFKQAKAKWAKEELFTTVWDELKAKVDEVFKVFEIDELKRKLLELEK